MTSKLFSIDFLENNLIKSILFKDNIPFNYLERIINKKGFKFINKISQIDAQINFKQKASDDIIRFFIESIICNDYCGIKYILIFFEMGIIKLKILFDVLEKYNFQNKIDSIKIHALENFLDINKLDINIINVNPLTIPLLLNNSEIAKFILKYILKFIIDKKLQFAFPSAIFTLIMKTTPYKYFYYFDDYFEEDNEEEYFLNTSYGSFNIIYKFNEKIIKKYHQIDELSNNNRIIQQQNLKKGYWFKKSDYLII